MITEDKELLIKYLCMALPYGVKGLRTYNKEEVVELSGILPCCNVSRNSDRTFIELQFTNLDCCVIDKYKPYLRPMSSMTKEEKETYYNLCYEEESDAFKFGEWMCRIHYHDTIDSIDWLNAHHFDYRGLIEKGLAIEVTKDNNPYED